MAGSFRPLALVVPARGGVLFTNRSPEMHAVVLAPDSLADENWTLFLPPAAHQGKPVQAAGVYHYYCPFHADWDERLRAVVPKRGLLTMQGLLVVTGSAQDRTAPAAARVDASEQDLFRPWWCAIRRGGSVTWQNASSREQTITFPSPSPVDRRLPPGGSWTQTFSRPGAFYYYSRPRAVFDPAAGQARALKDAAASYPAAMDGVVVVI